MFLLGYLILVAIAAIPLLRTVRQHRGGPPSLDVLHRLYRDLAYIAAAVVAIIVLETMFRISLESYWFAELGQQHRFWFALGLQVAIFAAVFVFGGLFIGFNLQPLQPACRRHAAQRAVDRRLRRCGAGRLRRHRACGHRCWRSSARRRRA